MIRAADTLDRIVSLCVIGLYIAVSGIRELELTVVREGKCGLLLEYYIFR